jgi:hypothetical protein
MKRLRRIIFNVLTVLSLLLCVATVGLWVRSYFAMDRLAISRFSDEGKKTFWTWDELKVGKGGIGFNRHVQSGDRATFRNDMRRMTSRASPSNAAPLWYQTNPPEYPDFRFASASGDPSIYGFKWGRFSGTEAGYHRPTNFSLQIVVPIWLVFVVTLCIPLVWLRARRPFRKPGQCAKCGYDLRATPDRCPECGAIPAKAKA